MARIFGSLSREPGPILAGFHAAPAAADDGGTDRRRPRTQRAHAGESGDGAARALCERRKPDRRAAQRPGPAARQYAIRRTAYAIQSTGDGRADPRAVHAAARRDAPRRTGPRRHDQRRAARDRRRRRAPLPARPRRAAARSRWWPCVRCRLRQPDDREAGTKATTLFVQLGSPRSGAGARLREIVASTTRAKAEQRSMSNEASLDFALLAFGLWLTSHAFGLDAYTKPVVNFVVSNVGGTEGRELPRPLAAGRAFPISMIADPAGLNFTMLSHDGRMDVGIIANRAALPDAEPTRRALPRRVAATQPCEAASGLDLEEAAGAQAVADAAHAAEPAIVVRRLALEERRALPGASGSGTARCSMPSTIADAACSTVSTPGSAPGRQSFRRGR